MTDHPTNAGLPAPGATMTHYVSDAPFDPNEAEQTTSAQARYAQASQLQLMWWQFRKHRIAYYSGIFLILMYASVFISEFLAPYAKDARNTDYIYAPPQDINFFHDGSFVGPFVYGRTQTLDMDTLQRIYTDDPADVQKIRFFCRGDDYEFWGLFPGNLHLICPAKDGQLFLLGLDDQKGSVRVDYCSDPKRQTTCCL